MTDNYKEFDVDGTPIVRDMKDLPEGAKFMGRTPQGFMQYYTPKVTTKDVISYDDRNEAHVSRQLIKNKHPVKTVQKFDFFMSL